jgi:hypothetical protein
MQFWLLLSTLSCLGALLAERLRGRGWLLSPAQVFALSHLVVFPLSTALMLRRPQLDGWDLLGTAHLALALQVLAMVAFSAGYWAGLGRPALGGRGQQEGASQLRLAFWVLAAAGLLGLSLQLGLGIYWHAAVLRLRSEHTYVAHFLTRLGLLAPVAAALLGKQTGLRRWSVIRYLAVGGMVLFLSLGGKREEALLGLLLQVYAELLLWHGQRRVLLRRALPAVVAAVLLIPAVDYYRRADPFELAHSSWAQRGRRLLEVSTQTVLRPRGFEEPPLDRLTVRLFEGATAGRIVELTPSVLPYAGLRGLEGLLYVYVPRSLYPGKPRLDDGAFVAESYGVGVAQSGSAPPTLLGDFYRRGGYPGVLLGMALLGLAVGGLTRRLGWPPRDALGALFGAYLWMSAFRWYAETALSLGAFVLRDAAVVFLFLRLLLRGPRP